MSESEPPVLSRKEQRALRKQQKRQQELLDAAAAPKPAVAPQPKKLKQQQQKQQQKRKSRTSKFEEALQVDNRKRQKLANKQTLNLFTQSHKAGCASTPKGAPKGKKKGG